MNPQIKERWIAALRSGEYKQGYQQLRTENGYCCLGVLCELHAKETNTPWVHNTYLGHPGTLPNEVCKWANLSEGDPLVFLQYLNRQEHLTKINDCGSYDSYDFGHIANLIQESL